MPRRRALAAVALGLLTACGSGGPPAGDVAGGPSAADRGGAATAQTAATELNGPDVQAQFPDVVGVELTPAGDVWDVAVTISSPYDTPERYADGWRVTTLDGEVLGTHSLAHDHAGEQPFTRVQRGLEVPPGVERVMVEGRDLRNGYGGRTMTVDVPR